MCGRFTICSSIKKISHEFDITSPSFDINPSYNIAPTHEILIVVGNGERKLLKCKWGFIPSWSKDSKIGYKMINARAESVAEKPSFKTVFKHQRCLVVADGFFEWRKVGKDKMPVYIHLKSGAPFGFAGLYNYWTSPDGGQLCTSTIITTNANELLASIHNRMPVIISKKDYDTWIDPDTRDEKILKSLLKPYMSDEMEAYYVSSRVNTPKNNTEDNIEPIGEFVVDG